MTPEDILIQELRKENASLREELASAIQEIPHICPTCKYEEQCSEETDPKSSRYCKCNLTGNLWEWRGRCSLDNC